MTSPQERFREGLLWALIPLATFLVYFPAIQGGLIMDDAEHITPAALQSLGGLGHIWFEIGATPHYYPVLNSAFWLEHHLWGAAPAGYHLVNLVQHAAAACLVVLLAQRLKLPGAHLAGLVFAVHPVHVESVAWISEQKNTLSTLFALGAAVIYLDYQETRRTRTYGLASGLFLLALLTKTVVAVVPPALLVVIAWQRGRLHWRRDVVPLLPWFVVGAALGLFSAWFEQAHSHAQGDAFQLSWLARALIAGRAVCFYAHTLAWPVNLMYINPRWALQTDDLAAYGGLVLVGLTGLALWLLARRRSGPLAAYLLYVGMLFPVLGFLNINWFNFSFVANHFQYLPSIGLIIPFAAAGHSAAQRWLPGRAAPLGAALLVGALGWLGRVHCEEYRTPERLYASTVAKNPACWLAHNNLGVLLFEQLDGLPRALHHFETALALKPDHARGHNNYATALLRADRLDEALAHYQRSLELQGEVAEVHFNYGQALLQRAGRLQEALAHFARASELSPGYGDPWIARAEALAGVPGQEAAAIASYEAALVRGADRPEVHLGLAGVLARQPGRREESIGHYRAALRLNPELAEACNNLGALLANDPATRPEALRLLAAAVRLAPDYFDARFNLGMMLGRAPATAPEAIVQLRAAARLRPDDPEVQAALAALGAR